MSDELSDIRKAIDGIDGALMALLAKRFAEVKKVTEVKHRLGLPASVPARKEAVITKVRTDAERQGFPPDTAEKLWRLLIAEMERFEEQHLGK